MAQVKVFNLGGIGTPCCCTPAHSVCSVTILVAVCGDRPVAVEYPIAGATVTIKTLGGATVDSGVSDASGYVVLNIVTSGTYNVYITGSGFPDPTSTFLSIFLHCQSVYILGPQPGVDSGFVCCHGKPYPLSLTLTDDGGTIPLFLDFGGLSTNVSWIGCYQLGVGTAATPCDCAFGVEPTGSNCTIHYRVTCDHFDAANSRFSIGRNWKACSINVMGATVCFYCEDDLDAGCLDVGVACGDDPGPFVCLLGGSDFVDGLTATTLIPFALSGSLAPGSILGCQDGFTSPLGPDVSVSA